jgi:hypothetical protein
MLFNFSFKLIKMKASLFIAGASALLASAKPINKRVLETAWVTDYVTVTVVAGEEQAAQATDVVVLEAQPTTTTTTIKKTVQKSKVVEQPKASYTTVWVESQPTTTSEPEVQYSTVWVQAEEDATTSSSTTSTSTTSKKAVATATKAATEETTTTSSSSSDSLSLKADYSTVMTNYHNLHRANHSVSDVAWDSGLAASALILANRCKFEHDM